jgi:TonB family protein
VKSLILKTSVALVTFTVGMGCVRLMSLLHSPLKSKSEIPAPVDVVNDIEPTESKTPSLDDCEGARERVKRMMTADWYRPARYTVSGGNLRGRRICKPTLVYPQEAVDAKISGAVYVRLLVNESGAVISARAFKGPKALRKAAVETARGTVFTPTLLGGEPVNVEGYIIYMFVPEPHSAEYSLPD